MIKINYGCGRRVQNGFYNIDAQHNPKAPRPPELLHALEFDEEGNLLEQTPLEDGFAEELYCFHLIEHFYRWQANSVINEFKRLLKPNGLLVLELPNIELACRNLLKGMDDQMSMWPLYGDWGHKDPYMMHKHGYTPKTITKLLEECGFKNIKMLPPQTHKRRTNRDMRVEAIK